MPKMNHSYGVGLFRKPARNIIVEGTGITCASIIDDEEPTTARARVRRQLTKDVTLLGDFGAGDNMVLIQLENGAQL